MELSNTLIYKNEDEGYGSPIITIKKQISITKSAPYYFPYVFALHRGIDVIVPCNTEESDAAVFYQLGKRDYTCLSE